MNDEMYGHQTVYQDTISMKDSFIEWLELRLPVYLREADKVIDLTTYKFKYKGITYTQKEIIEKMITDIASLKEMKNDNDSDNLKQEVAELWAEVLPVMWW